MSSSERSFKYSNRSKLTIKRTGLGGYPPLMLFSYNEPISRVSQLITLDKIINSCCILIGLLKRFLNKLFCSVWILAGFIINICKFLELNLILTCKLL